MASKLHKRKRSAHQNQNIHDSSTSDSNSPSPKRKNDPRKYSATLFGTQFEDEAFKYTQFQPYRIEIMRGDQPFKLAINILNWNNPEPLTIPALRLPKDFANRLAKVNEVTSLLELNVEKNMQWKEKNPVASEKLSCDQKDILLGFLDGFRNATGRLAAANWLSYLFGEEKHVRNIGGRSSSVFARHVKFNVESVAPFNSDTPPSGGELGQEVSFDKHERELHMDILVTQNTKDLVGDDQIIVEVKSAPSLCGNDTVQLRYQMLPALMKKDTVLGLMISATQAYAVKFTINQNTLVLSQKKYKFCEQHVSLTSSFEMLCRDIYQLVGSSD